MISMSSIELNSSFYGLTKSGANQLFTSLNNKNSQNSSGLSFSADLYRGFLEVNSIGYRHLLKAYFNTNTEDSSSTEKESILNQLNNTIDTTKTIALDTKELKACGDNLSSAINVLKEKSKDGESVLFTKERSDIDDAVNNLVKNYNDLINKTSNSSYSNSRMSSLNMNLKVIASVNASSLSSIGISVNSNGTLTIDKEVYEKASIDEIEKVLGSQSGFINSIASKAEDVSSNAARYTNNSIGTYSTNAIANYNTDSLFNSFF